VAGQPTPNEVARGLIVTRGARRDFVPIRRAFLQTRRRGGGAAPLSWFVKAHRKRALELYLLVHALASVDPYDVALPARVWTLALGLPDTASSRVSISSSWTWLEEHRLVRTKRDGRLRRIWLLDESGSGEPYTHGAHDENNRLDYFKLPYSFWLEGWSERLDLPALAVLLIGLSLPRTFVLPHERGGEWYGVSRDTIRRGVAGLRELELLTMRISLRQTPLSPTGATEQRRYTLQGPFAAKHRRARQLPPAPDRDDGQARKRQPA
jgi:hypothetical protein